MKGKKQLIPMSDIKSPIRKLAVIWGDAYNWDIWNVHKLASDIQHTFNEMYSKNYDWKDNLAQDFGYKNLSDMNTDERTMIKESEKRLK